ncbi:MAG: FtsH protease activity modulator HflK [Azonexus sp.]|nr:FtsH protease activity modulator HflK [Azonexus sp.]
MSLNDPQWGNKGGDGNNNRPGGGPRRPNDGPPDLEELWRDLNKKLSETFGKKGRGSNNDSGNNGGNGGGNGPRMPDFNPKFLGGGIGILIALAVVIWLASGFYIVGAAQRGIVLQFGRFNGQVTEAGLRWRFPYPIESYELVNLSDLRSLEIGYRGTGRTQVLKEALMLTDDENIVNVQFAVQYMLKDPIEYSFNNRSPDDAVMGAAESAIREIVGKSQADFVLYEGREQIATKAAQLMQDILDRYKSGILISKVTMQDTQPPEKVQEAFSDAINANQDRQRQINEGQAYANDVIPRARGAAARLLEEANGYRQRVVAAAEGDASRFRQIQSEYAKAPEVTRQRLYRETMQQIYASTTKVLIDAKGQGNLLYLPLDKLMQSAAAVPAAAAGEAPATPGRAAPPLSTTAPPQVERPVGVDTGAGLSRSSGSLQSRDREGR